MLPPDTKRTDFAMNAHDIDHATHGLQLLELLRLRLRRRLAELRSLGLRS